MAVANKPKLYGLREAKCVRRHEKPVVFAEKASQNSSDYDFDTPVIRHRKYSLEELLEGITPENLHSETKTGHSVGCEF